MIIIMFKTVPSVMHWIQGLRWCDNQLASIFPLFLFCYLKKSLNMKSSARFILFTQEGCLFDTN